MKIDVRNRDDAYLFSGLNGAVEICFPDATAEQIQTIDAMFSRGWSVETTLTRDDATIRLVHTAPELAAVVSFIPAALSGNDARLLWGVSDLSSRGHNMHHDSSDWLAGLIELAHHLDEIRPRLSSET